MNELQQLHQEYKSLFIEKRWRLSAYIHPNEHPGAELPTYAIAVMGVSENLFGTQSLNELRAFIKGYLASTRA